MQIGAFTVLAWTLAWWLTGLAMYISGVFNSPRTGPLWFTLAGGTVSWALAGAYSFQPAGQESSRRPNQRVMLIWALAFPASLLLASTAARVLSQTLGGFTYMLLGWGLGPALGAFASTLLLADRSRLKRSLVLGGTWLLGFFGGSYVALVGLYLGPELGKISVGSLIGMRAALALGAGFGAALGGLAGSASAAGLTRLVLRRQ
jgi:hypothetical protein